MVSDSLSEALYYQEQLGGAIQILNKWELKEGETTYPEEFDGLPIKQEMNIQSLTRMFIYSLKKRKLNYQMVFVILKSLFIKYIMTI